MATETVAWHGSLGSRGSCGSDGVSDIVVLRPVHWLAHLSDTYSFTYFLLFVMNLTSLIRLKIALFPMTFWVLEFERRGAVLYGWIEEEQRAIAFATGI